MHHHATQAVSLWGLAEEPDRPSKHRNEPIKARWRMPLGGWMAVDRGFNRGEMSLDWWRLDVDTEAPAQDYLALRIGGRKGTEGKRETVFSSS